MNSSASLIFNPASGRVGTKERLLPRILTELRRVGIEAVPARSLSPGHATILAEEALARQVDLVLVWGGDGTLNEVVRALVGSRTPVGLIPGGSVNVFARAADIPLRARAACRLLPYAEPRAIPVGIAGDRPFLLMAGIGLDAEVIHRLDSNIKKRLGRLAFWLKGFSLLATYPFPCFAVRVEGREYLGTSLVAGKTPLYGGGYVITPEARLEERRLHVVLFQGRSGIDYLRFLVGVLLGFHLRFPDVVNFKTTRLEVESQGPLLCQVDGEEAGKAPVVVGLHKQTVRMLLPGAVASEASGTLSRSRRFWSPLSWANHRNGDCARGS